jgi:hypothetical protein
VVGAGALIYVVTSQDDDGGVAAATTTTQSTTVSTTTGFEVTTTSSPTTTAVTSTTTLAATTTTTLAATTTTTLAVTTTTAPPTLDYSLPANYGEFALTAGFIPDPAQYDATSGGVVDASYLGSGCLGFASQAPDLKVNYTPGAYPTVRFYFLADGVGADTILIINSPTGAWHCNDDSWGTLNPTIDFNSPVGGRYDIWLASLDAGDVHPGTLYVTENLANHP